MNELQRILEGFDRHQNIGEPAALATVVRTRGSVYRKPGARMLVAAGSGAIGAISGGCLEADVLARSREILGGGDPVVVRYDSTNFEEDLSVGFGMGCNGVVDVLIESLGCEAATRQLSFIRDCLRSRQFGVIATVFAVEGVPDIAVGSRLMVKSDGTAADTVGDDDLTRILAADLRETLIDRKSRTRSYTRPEGKIDVLLEVIRPPLPLLVFGAGYDAIPVVRLAKQLGWHVTVIDHRPEHLTGDRFPEADALLECSPDLPDSYSYLLTPQTVAVVMTHRYRSDLAFLKTLVPSPLRYLGVLGPERRMGQLWGDLAKWGVGPTPGRLYNPVGLDIGAETPEEIALAIVAEIQAVVTDRPSGFLRDRGGSIHPPKENSWLPSASSS